jgi:uncharacterized protein YndB with AHSA1/START domain
MQRIEIDQNFALPVERVFAYLSEHENLATIFGVKVARVRDGHDSRNGAGSVRQLRIGLLPPFEETVTSLVPNERIEYQISKGSPLKDHRGVMEFSAQGSGSHLHYVIEFNAAPGLAQVVKFGLERSIRNGLTGVDSAA